jgi:hypothetical protein
MTPSRRMDPMEHGTRAPRTARPAICAVLALLVAMPSATAQAAPPDNDDFGNAQLVRVGDRVTGTTTDATLQSGEPAAGASHTRSVWYRLTPAASEALRIDNCGGGPWAELAIYTGPGLGALTEAPVSRTGCSSGSRVYLDAVAATTYYIRITGYDPGPGYGPTYGPLVLTVARPQAPANDHFANAQPVGRPAHVAGTTVDATVQAGEPVPAVYGGSGHSVWYRLAATTSDVVVASIAPAANQPAVAVYTGDAVNRLTEVGTEGGPTGPRTTMIFATTPGTTYYIAVRGHGDGASDFTLDVSAPEPPSAPPNGLIPPAPPCWLDSDPTLIIYSGTHSAGGTVCLRVTKDRTGLAWFSATNVPGDRCMIPWFSEAMFNLPAPIDNGRFSFGSPYSRLLGSFPTDRTARGTLQATQRNAQGACHSAAIDWTASTIARADLQAPSLHLGGATVQRPLRGRRALVVLVRCRGEACAASASATVAGVRLTAAKRTVRPSAAGRAVRLALPSRARSALARALRTKRSVKVRVTVVARDAAGNRATGLRTITLRR